MAEHRAGYGTRSMFEMTAWEMRAYAIAHPWKPGMRMDAYRRRADAGLVIEFYWDTRTEVFILALAREDRDPVDDECARARDAFGAPLLLTQALSPYRVQGWHVCKFTWKVKNDRMGLFGPLQVQR